jgi:4-coumarate--CoA ligase
VRPIVRLHSHDKAKVQYFTRSGIRTLSMYHRYAGCDLLVDFSTERTNLSTAEIEMTSLIYMVKDANTVLSTSCLASADPYLYIYGTSTGARFVTEGAHISLVPVPMTMRFLLSFACKNRPSLSKSFRCGTVAPVGNAWHQSAFVNSSRRCFATASESDDISDRCNANLVHRYVARNDLYSRSLILYSLFSPFPPIPDGPFPPLYEFITQKWESKGGHLGDKVAIIDGHTGQQRTFRDYCQTTSAIAESLRRDFGLETGGTLAVYAPNHVDYLPVALAVALIGAKVTPINPQYTRNELEKIIQQSRSTVVVAHTSTLGTVLAAAKNCPNLRHVLLRTDTDLASSPEQGVTTVDQMRSEYPESVLKASLELPALDTHPVYLPFSSGTTGLPKGVSLSHHNIVANLLQIDMVEEDVLTANQKFICPLPFFHIYAFSVALLYPAWKGNTVITSSGRFDLEHFCKMVQEHRPERAILVPPIILGLAKHPSVEKYDLSSLKTVVSAAAPLCVAIAKSASERLGGALIKEAWGMSELSPLGTLNRNSKSKAGSVGPLAPSTVGKVIDTKTGKSLPPNTPGELLLKGPQVMMGYIDEPEKTKECLSESGWLRTGDIAHYDEEGYFFITDRIKELIKTRGFQVAPAELELLLLTNEAIQDVAVIPFPDDASGELPRAYVVLKPGVSVTEDQIKDWIKPLVAPFKRLEGGVVFTDSIPKSATGKILRRVLRDQLKQELLA